MGHAGAIVGEKNDTAIYKINMLKKCGIKIIKSPSQIGDEVFKILNLNN